MNRLLLVLAALLGFVSSSVSAQTAERHRPDTLPNRATINERKIVAHSASPFVTSKQLDTVLRILQQPCPFQWNERTTPIDITRDLTKLFPVELDVKSLRELGIDPNRPLLPGYIGKADDAPRDSSDDPFTPPTHATTKAGSAKHAADWWKS